MEDRFKFRVWDKKERRFWEDCVINNDGQLFRYNHLDEMHVQFMEYYTIQQCTGLKDKNGKLIFEGDIVNFQNKNMHKPELLGRVQYDMDRMCWCFSDNLSPNSYGLPCSDHFDDGIATEAHLEIIGNIFENPELLENK